MVCSAPDAVGRGVDIGEGGPEGAGEEGDDAAGMGGGAAVVVAFLPEAPDVGDYVAREAAVWGC